ncbi:sigma-54-dependent Fis family transcriptional regulator [Roseinatronobacter alkalisoli]|uniref:XylR N-terminal domain-containing protein n=1 Tax=Roseinatronobacter alkalisoli TaxID=3028235 RepID=A0ABT5T9V0_9RHOB|nr:sigma-54-dependent Fis family transcriptional regulator [Roseinatronobacter sp. HJB301]MDD7970952.1 XylR N-terminal domain-containing protein [Roseinatronobacter sp. HJB301]
MTKRISLTEASRHAPRITARGDSRLLEEGAPPTLADLAGALQFALGDGRIWLNDERMIMMQTRVLGNLRKEAINALGIDAARSLFYRAGWVQGKQYADLVQKRFNQQDLTAALAAGPRIHTMEGFVKVTTKRFEFDIKRGYYHGEFHWHDSTEAQEHLTHFGVSECPTCWMQVGAPAGFTSALLGQPVIFREVECAGMGAERCVVIGRNASAWGADVPELQNFSRAPAPPPAQAAPWTPPIDLKAPTSAPEIPHQIIGRTAGIERAKRLLERVAGYDEPVLFLGEPGTGKEYFAHRLHDIGRTPKGPFITVNCGGWDDGQTALPLLGPDGALARAKGGTLFLNDIFALPPAQQSLLATQLTADNPPQPLRIMSASSAAPREAMKSGAFRSDLYFRLSLLPIVIPPLRERRDDVPMMIDHFLRLHSRKHRKPLRQISGAALGLLLRYDFPGNVRELSNMIERGVIYAEPGGDLEISHLFTGVEEMPEFVEGLHMSGRIVRRAASAEPATDGLTFAEIEAETYANALQAAEGNVSAAARALGLTRAKLEYRLRKLNLIPDKPGT